MNDATEFSFLGITRLMKPVVQPSAYDSKRQFVEREVIYIASRVR
jgi:hypothetical protein